MSTRPSSTTRRASQQVPRKALDGARELHPSAFTAGQHQRLIDETPFLAVQALLASRNLARDKPQTRPHPLKGTIYGGRCGRRFGLVYANGHGWPAPVPLLPRSPAGCRCHQGYISVKRLVGVTGFETTT